MKRALILVGISWLLVVLIRKSPMPSTHELHGRAMGCSWTLAWRGGAATPADFHHAVATTLEHWEQVLSQWRENSDLSRFNRGEAPTHELSRALTHAEAIKEASGGAFDHQLLEKVHAAGFGPAGVGVDLSSIGKGFAVDRVVERLHELGLRDFIFNLAGEAYAGDGDWEIGIERPDPSGIFIAETLTLRNQAIATTGNYRQFYPSEGGMKSHIIDPTTGQPVIRPPSSVTVVASDCASASAWATAHFVAGPDSDFRRAPAGLKIRWQTHQAPKFSASHEN
jgi:thiamine biosynthesis lipoprotein